MPTDPSGLVPDGGGLDVDELARLATRLFVEQVGPLNVAPTDVPASPVVDPSTLEALEALELPSSLDQQAEMVPPGATGLAPTAGAGVGTAGPTSFVPSQIVPALRSVAARAPGAHYYFVDPEPPGTAPGYYFVREPEPGGGATGRVPPVAAAFDPYVIRRDFPLLEQRVHGKPLVWLDNAATTQKPTAVIDRLVHFYEHENSNIHRGAHELAARATDAYEAARDTVARFLGAPSSDDIVFVRGTTEGINLVAQAWGRTNIGEGDEIVLSHLEHHANIVPWQMLASERGAKLRVIPVDDDGQILLDEYRRLLNDRTKLVAVTHVSNALGTIVPVHDVVDQAHAAGVAVLIDGAQSTPHMPVDVAALDPDFYVFSGHKVFGPTGIGALYGKREVLASMPPWEGGGNMIRDVTFERTEYQDPPGRFEAGTGNIADAVGLDAALDYVMGIGMDNIAAYEHALTRYATARLCEIPGLRLIGTAPDKAGVLSFILEGHSPESVGTALNQEGIAVRAGHHCAQPILRRFGLEATVRPSLSFYNTSDDVDALIAALRRIVAGVPLG